jgi:hypothetical protein
LSWMFLVGVFCGQLSLGTEALRQHPPTANNRSVLQAAIGGPAWKLDVHALGYLPLEFMVHEGNRAGLSGPICFVSRDEVVVTFVTRLVSSSLPRRDQPDASLPLRLQALFVDTGTGKVRSKREWPISSYWSRVLPAVGGKFVVLTPEKLMLYSQDGEPLKELDLPLNREAIKDTWRVYASPAGKYLVIEYEPKTSGLQQMWIDAETLQVLRVWTKGEMGHALEISDDGTALTWDGKIGKPDGPFHALCAPINSYCHGGAFIDNETVVSVNRWGSEKRLNFVGTDGELMFVVKLPQAELLPGPGVWASSAGGRRFALAVYKGKGGSTLLDIAPHYFLKRVMVYDIPSRQWVYAVDGKKQKIKRVSGLALSPDGSLLGLINQDGALEVYRLPEAPTVPGQSAAKETQSAPAH